MEIEVLELSGAQLPSHPLPSPYSQAPDYDSVITGKYETVLLSLWLTVK